MLITQIRKYYEDTTGEEIATERYNSLSMSPVHIFKDKKAHEEALLTLGNEIVSHIHQHPAPGVRASSGATSQKVPADQ